MESEHRPADFLLIIRYPPNSSHQFFHSHSVSLLPHVMFDPGARLIRGHDHGGDRGHAYSGFAFRDRGLAQIDESRGGWTGDREEVQFRANRDPAAMASDDDSGYCSPPLWNNSPSPSHPLLRHRGMYGRPLSPNSRVQTIVSGQRELMEMVRNMPESSYELSLKDLVEHPHRTENQSRPRLDGLGNNPNLRQRGAVRVKGRESNKIDKNVSFENQGLFLKMGFPISVQRKNNGGKVSPKPVTSEKDWWKRKFTGSSDSDSSRTSNNSGSTAGSSSSGGTNVSHGGDRKKNGFLNGCWPFLRSKRSKSL